MAKGDGRSGDGFSFQWRRLRWRSLRGRFVAPEVFRNEAYDTKMIEGCPPFSTKLDNDVPKAYASSKQRPLFTAPLKLYSPGLKAYLILRRSSAYL